MRRVIGAYIGLVSGVDLLVFTGAIGEHSDQIRSAATNRLEFLGLTAEKFRLSLRRKKNRSRALSHNHGTRIAGNRIILTRFTL